MLTLIAGLILFLGAHSARIVAEPARQRFIDTRGPLAWKALYSVFSVLGFVLIIQGYGQARMTPEVLWATPLWVRHLASVLTLAAFVLLAAAYVPRNAIKAKLHHPMVLAVKAWALAHLVSNNTLADVVMFGAFLVWAVLSFRAARQRDRLQGQHYPAGTMAGTGIAVAVGLSAWAGFALWAHQAWIGVRPFG